MRSITILSVVLSAGIVAAVGMRTAHAQGTSQCETRTSPGDTRDVECTLEPAAPTQRFRFKAKFSGGHDDTSAAITATLNGSPLVCGEGSKTSLMGEDGDISLECKFVVARTAATKHLLRVAITWRHAEYTDFELHAD